MKTEKEIKIMADEIITQMGEIKENNPYAYRKLEQRLIALLWVLDIETKTTRDKLTFTQKQLEILECLF